jgi:hypothetical protein
MKFSKLLQEFEATEGDTNQEDDPECFLRYKVRLVSKSMQL